MPSDSAEVHELDQLPQATKPYPVPKVDTHLIEPRTLKVQFSEGYLILESMLTWSSLAERLENVAHLILRYRRRQHVGGILQHRHHLAF